MTFLPVVERELRVASRRRGTYWSRLLMAVAGWAVAAWILLAADARNGAVVFKVLAVLVFAYSVVAGLLATSDCVSEEKRDGTLGLLFLTDLKGYDVVFGKLASSSLVSIYAVMAVAPALAISMSLGAVTQGEVARVVLVALNLLFFFLGAGLLASAVCRQDNRSLAMAALLSLAILTAIPGLVGRKPNRAALLALIQILLVPYLLFFAFAVMGSGSTPNAFSVLIFTNILGIGSGFFFAQHANTRLVEWFRRVVADGVPPKFRNEPEADIEPALEGVE